MKFILLLSLAIGVVAHATDSVKEVSIVTIPYMERASLQRQYTNALLRLALETSENSYGPYKIVQQAEQTVLRRQLQDLERGINLSVANSMPMPEWLEKAQMIPFPIMKGLASYRLFFSHQNYLSLVGNIDNLETLKGLKIGQGQGWSTGKLLEDNGFQVVYGGPDKTLIPMLKANRFQLLMRSSYEIAPELARHKPAMQELEIVDGIAVYTYLPMYFFVAKNQPILAERIEYGLKKAHASGAVDDLFQQYFSEALTLLNVEQRKIFHLTNTNIDPSFYENDKPYLLDPINKLEAERRTGTAPF